MFLNFFKNNINLILTIFGVCLFLVAVSFSYVKYFENKDFLMTLESSCNPENESCFYRDCSLEECPPNSLEVYKYVDVPAWFFSNCKDNSCTSECIKYSENCNFTYCDPDSDENVCWEPNINEN